MNRTERKASLFFFLLSFFLASSFCLHWISFIICLYGNNRCHRNAAIFQFYYFFFFASFWALFFIICLVSPPIRMVVSFRRAIQSNKHFDPNEKKSHAIHSYIVFFFSQDWGHCWHTKWKWNIVNCVVGRFMWGPMRYGFVGEIATCIIWFIAIYFAQITLKSYGRRHPCKRIPK